MAAEVPLVLELDLEGVGDGRRGGEQLTDADGAANTGEAGAAVAALQDDGWVSETESATGRESVAIVRARRRRRQR